MKNLLNILLAVSLVVILIGGTVIMTNPAYASPGCCHCTCNCDNPDQRMCQVPAYLPLEECNCGDDELRCGYGFGGWCWIR